MGWGDQGPPTLNQSEPVAIDDNSFASKAAEAVRRCTSAAAQKLT
jgi:hypothetical protein